MSELEQRISVEQVRVGMYIQLEDWMDHPFLFSRFKVRNEKQVEVLRSLKMTHVLYDPAKSDVPPLPPPAFVFPRTAALFSNVEDSTRTSSPRPQTAPPS